MQSAKVIDTFTWSYEESSEDSLPKQEIPAQEIFSHDIPSLTQSVKTAHDEADNGVTLSVKENIQKCKNLLDILEIEDFSKEEKLDMCNLLQIAIGDLANVIDLEEDQEY